MSTCDLDEAIVQADIDLGEVDSFRTQVPISLQERHDIYAGVTLRNDLPAPPRQ